MIFLVACSNSTQGIYFNFRHFHYRCCFSVGGWIDGMDMWTCGQRDAYVAFTYSNNGNRTMLLNIYTAVPDFTEEHFRMSPVHGSLVSQSCDVGGAEQ